MSAQLVARRGALIDHGRLLDVLGIEGSLLAAAAHDVPPDRRVPGCPGWTVGETVRHVGGLYRMVLAWLVDRRRPEYWQNVEQSTSEFLAADLRLLTAELARRRSDEPCSTWWPADESYGFWRRRLAHESTMHRVDVQSARGEAPSAIADDVAVDGVDEVLCLWFAHRLRMLGVSGTRSASVLVRTGGHEWMVRTEPGSTTAGIAGGVDSLCADAIIIAEPASMYLWLWGRLPVNAVHTDGDLDAAAQLWALLRMATR